MPVHLRNMERGDRRLTGLPGQVLSERKFVGGGVTGRGQAGSPGSDGASPYRVWPSKNQLTPD